MTSTTLWRVWADARYPVFTGTEDDARDHLITVRADNSDVYLESPTGQIEIYVDGVWVDDT